MQTPCQMWVNHSLHGRSTGIWTNRQVGSPRLGNFSIDNAWLVWPQKKVAKKWSLRQKEIVFESVSNLVNLNFGCLAIKMHCLLRVRAESQRSTFMNTTIAVRALYFGIEVELIDQMDICSLVRFNSQTFIVDSSDLILERNCEDPPMRARHAWAG